MLIKCPESFSIHKYNINIYVLLPSNNYSCLINNEAFNYEELNEINPWLSFVFVVQVLT